MNLFIMWICIANHWDTRRYTIATNTKLTYVQPGLNGWQRFWRSKGGEAVVFGLYIAGLLLSAICPAFAPLFFMAIATTAVTLVIGGSIAGISSKRQGKGFWSGFNNHINQNWSQSLGISIALTMITFGISQAVQAIANAGSKVKLANSAADEMLQFQSSAKLEYHFAEHGSQFKGMYANAEEYLAGANKVIQSGVYDASLNGYKLFYRVTSKGKNLYHFVGITRGSPKNITTYHPKIF